MHLQFATDWNRLGQLAFKRHERIGGMFKRVYRLLRTHRTHPDIRWLQLIKNWMLVPFTLWPVDFTGLAGYVCSQLWAGKRIEPGVLFALNQLQVLPDVKSQSAISEYEKYVEQGDYEPLIRAATKYSSQERALLKNERLQSEWKDMKQLFNVERLRGGKGIIRRRMAQERNFRTNWQFTKNTKEEQFRLAFDSFCHRWNLYGMEGDKPLLLKLSVNPTAHGLLIMIPSYWSLDSRRDLNWAAINKLHKARGALRQGPKMSEGRLERHEQARRAYLASVQASELHLHGENRLNFIAARAALTLGTDPRLIRRLVREGRHL